VRLGGERGSHFLRAVAMDHEDPARPERARGIQNVAEQRLAGKRMQDLRQVRAHALALACSENDYIQRHRADFSAVLGANLWQPAWSGSLISARQLAPQPDQRGSSENPIRNSSTERAHCRPSRIAQTTSDCPRRMSPAAKSLGTDVE